MMTTKEQERKALEQIRKIVAGLGDDSYVATAFEGCFDDAEYNIEYDAAMSMADRVASYAKELSEMRDERDLFKERDSVHCQQIRELNEQIATLKNEKQEYADDVIEKWNMFRAEEDKKIELEKTIIELKAKLYDLMTAND